MPFAANILLLWRAVKVEMPFTVNILVLWRAVEVEMPFAELKHILSHLFFKYITVMALCSVANWLD